MQQFRKTSERLSKQSDQDGQITVFVSLVFFLILGVGILVFGGMREYLMTTFAEEAFDLAGEDVLASYDKEMYSRYHLFVLDPREKTYMTNDVKNGMNHMLNGSDFFGEISEEIQLVSQENPLQHQGKAVLKQIKRWEITHGITEIQNLLSRLLKSTEKKEDVTYALDQCLNTDGEEEEDQTDDQSVDEHEGTNTADIEGEEVRQKWKEWKKTLEDIFKLGVLYYAVDDTNTLSNLNLEKDSHTPSRKIGADSIFFDLNSLSLTGFSNLKNLYGKGVSVDENSPLLKEDYYLIPYIFDHFTYFGKEDSEKAHCLKYEIEYLIGGKTEDKANLKNVANQLFLLRFMVNYGYAMSNANIKSEAETMALALTGILGFPEAEKAVSSLLIASLAYGESLLEVRALMRGKKVALTKKSENWNTGFHNVIQKVRTKAEIITVADGVDYGNYLAGMMVIRSGSRKLLYRMMDLMQANVALVEPGFLMEESLVSWKWEAKFFWKPWFKNIIPYDINWGDSITMEENRTLSYN